MAASSPTILATSMGFAPRNRGPYDWQPGPIFDLAFALAGAPERPRLCYLGTATGDDPARVAGVYGAFAGSAVRVSHLSLFPMPTVPDVRSHLLDQDVIWVGGGSVANLLAVWRVHGLDDVLREAWEAGVVLAVSRRLAVLAHRRHHRLLRSGAAAGHQRARLAAVLQRRALRLRGAAPAALPPAGGRRRRFPRLRHRRRRRPASTAAPNSSRPSPTGRTGRLPGRPAARAAAKETRVEPRLLASEDAVRWQVTQELVFVHAGAAAGLVPYEQAWDLQRELHDRRVADEISDTCCCSSTRRSTPPASAPSLSTGP